MKRKILIAILIIAGFLFALSFREQSDREAYGVFYRQQLSTYAASLSLLEDAVRTAGPDRSDIKAKLQAARYALKGADFWLRYLEPTTYKKLNGPLPVEWETEVFEKFEKPYRREGAGLLLAARYLEEPVVQRDSLLSLVHAAVAALPVYSADSITQHLAVYHHFYLCNRLFLLNLAAIYTTGFECPDTAAIIPELRSMLHHTAGLYAAFNTSFPETALPPAYLQQYRQLVAFCDRQPDAYSAFDHFTFIRDFVNPLYVLNQQLIRDYKVVSRNMADYSLNKAAPSIFSKDVYNGQQSKGIFLRVTDTAALAEMDHIGKLLFYDPVLSGNNRRSCASCHKPAQLFADTLQATDLQFDGRSRLERNTPSLINAGYNHLIMADGSHYTLQHQTRAVITNPLEMGCREAEVVRKVMSCKVYKAAFTRLLAYTPQEPAVTIDHIASVITYYYGKFSKAAAPFDNAMNKVAGLSPAAQRGFNLFMSKAQCGTCHFVPQFNGVKPPFVSSEFEVLGVPEDQRYSGLSRDYGRYKVNPAEETRYAFRTGTLRNTAHTAPYMHNGVFRSLEEVIDFYDAGGGAGHGLAVANQTLAADSLHLSRQEKADLLRFIETLNEQVVTELPPARLPLSSVQAWNRRQVGGIY